MTTTEIKQALASYEKINLHKVHRTDFEAAVKTLWEETGAGMCGIFAKPETDEQKIIFLQRELIELLTA